MLFTTLDPRSITQHLAFLRLYPDSPDAYRAEETLSQMLGLPPGQIGIKPEELQLAFNAFFDAISCRGKQITLSPETLLAIDKVARTLPHKQLKGHLATTEEEVLALPPSEIDLTRGLLLSQLGPDKKDEIATIEALCDLMAIQVKLRLSGSASIPEKVFALNHFIFYEMGFRFPPHATYAKDIDLYTFLPSVLDGRRGVCLGISILYICLAERLNLPLEMITPPGHIYIRAPLEEGHINIETTARGIDMPDEIYLSVECKTLPVRNVKEVIGMAHFNQASLFWLKEPEKAIPIYEKTLAYIPNDPLAEEILGYCHYLCGNGEKGRSLLLAAKSHPPTHLIKGHSMMDDLLEGRCDAEGLRVCYLEVDEKRDSLLKKRAALEEYLAKWPNFPSGWHSLAICQLQLLRQKEALYSLEKGNALARPDAEIAYYLSSLYLERREFEKAWSALRRAEQLCENEGHTPRVLKELHLELRQQWPEATTYSSTSNRKSDFKR